VGKSEVLLTRLNKSAARFSRECPWAVDLENMAMPGKSGTFLNCFAVLTMGSTSVFKSKGEKGP
jgi:hypothetical protein